MSQLVILMKPVTLSTVCLGPTWCGHYNKEWPLSNITHTGDYLLVQTVASASHQFYKHFSSILFIDSH